MFTIETMRRLALSLAVLAMTGTLLAQSGRSGWGATPYHDANGGGVTFRVWAPNATNAYVPGTFNGWSTNATALTKEVTNNVWNGVWSADVAGVPNGAQYKFRFNNYLWKQDPRARLVQQSGSGGNSIVYDPTVFNWAGDNFTNPPPSDLFIYELHIGTFYTNSISSKFVAATNKLDYLKSLGVNAVELMPICEFPTDDSWGYNPAQLFAVENLGYGGMDGFKTFVKACHAHGLAVLLDVVHNHYGPGDLEMWNFDGYSGSGVGGGIYFNQSDVALQRTPYGDTRPNFNSQQVRNFVQDNFTLWLDECHVDGFRWDTPNLMMQDNNGNHIQAADNLIYGINQMIHNHYTGKISISEDVYNYDDFNSAWDTSFPYAVTPVLTATADGGRDMNVIANAIQYNVRYNGTAGLGRVTFLETHDTTGDLNGGIRLAKAIDSATPNSYYARKRSTLGSVVTFTAPGIPMLFQGQEMLENQQFSSSRPVDWSKTVTYSGIVQLYRDLIGARRDLKGYTPGLAGDQCAMLQVDNVSKLVAFHRWKSAAPEQDAVVIANFGNTNYPAYTLNFPSAGTWYVHFNSDSTNYSADFGNQGSYVVTAGGNPVQATIAIAPYSALILSKIPDAPPQLKITPTNGVVNLSWPNTYSQWVLDTATNLNGNPISWSQVPTAQYSQNSTTLSANIMPSSDTLFFRLRK